MSRKGTTMTVQGIAIDDTDSLDAASDIVHFAEDYGNYLPPRANNPPPETATNPAASHGDAPDAPPPTPPPPPPGSPCGECTAPGPRRLWTGGRLADWIEVECGACHGT